MMLNSKSEKFMTFFICAKSGKVINQNSQNFLKEIFRLKFLENFWKNFRKNFSIFLNE